MTPYPINQLHRPIEAIPHIKSPRMLSEYGFLLLDVLRLYRLVRYSRMKKNELPSFAFWSYNNKGEVIDTNVPETSEADKELLEKISQRQKIARSPYDPLTCKRCGRSWIPRKPKKPIQCPKCKSPYWNRERKKPL